MCIVPIELLQRGQIGAKLSNLTEPGPNLSLILYDLHESC